jgi:hypothetical protein
MIFATSRGKLLDMRCTILSRFLRKGEQPIQACFWLEWALANVPSSDAFPGPFPNLKKYFQIR